MDSLRGNRTEDVGCHVSQPSQILLFHLPFENTFFLPSKPHGTSVGHFHSVVFEDALVQTGSALNDLTDEQLFLLLHEQLGTIDFWFCVHDRNACHPTCANLLFSLFSMFSSKFTIELA